MGKDIEYYMSLCYFDVTKDDQYTDGTPCVLAFNPELPGCMAAGDTRNDALANLIDARREYIAALLKRGIEVPVPAVLSCITKSTTETGASYFTFSLKEYTLNLGKSEVKLSAPQAAIPIR